MKNNPYKEAVKLEEEIVALKNKLRVKELDAEKVVERLQSLDPSSAKVPGLRNSLFQREKDISRTKKKLNEKINLKRKKENEGKRLQFGGNKKQKQRLAAHQDLNREIRNQDYILNQLSNLKLSLVEQSPTSKSKGHDLFISHASEDKESIVRPLAEELVSLGVSVWYDEYALRIGDSLRESIDKGLLLSRFGLIILSEAFFQKEWAKYELNGLVSKEMEGQKVILPIWHKISKDEVMSFSPTLADKVALNSSILSVKEIAEKVAEAVTHA